MSRGGRVGWYTCTKMVSLVLGVAGRKGVFEFGVIGWIGCQVSIRLLRSKCVCGHSGVTATENSPFYLYR